MAAMSFLKNTKSWVVAGVVLILLVLLSTWLVMPLLVTRADPNRLEQYGQVGDLFGLAGAVFAGIGLIGVAIALVLDTVDRKRSRRPFVTFQLGDDGVEITSVTWSSGPLDVRLAVKIELKNESQDPALNVVMQSPTLPAVGDGHSRVVLPSPLGSLGEEKAELKIRMHSDEAKEFLRKMSSGDVYEVELESTYASLNGANWKTSMKVNFSCRNTNDQDRIKQALSETPGAEIIENSGGQFAPRVFVLTTATIEGSWNQAPM